MAFGIANRILNFANGNVEYLLGKLDGIARTFGHEASMPQAAPSFHAMVFQSEALPAFSRFSHRIAPPTVRDSAPAPPKLRHLRPTFATHLPDSNPL